MEKKPYYRSIIDTLNSIEKPGIYAVGGETTMPLPAISLVDEPDTILGLPLCESQAKHVIELASRAPYGKGEKTIVDTSVRCTWQLEPKQFIINNTRWERGLNKLLAKVKLELGCDTYLKVACELYKLLLYKPGGFFKVRLLIVHVFIHTLYIKMCYFTTTCVCMQQDINNWMGAHLNIKLQNTRIYKIYNLKALRYGI